jgi:hypothetical protein
VLPFETVHHVTLSSRWVYMRFIRRGYLFRQEMNDSDASSK